MMLDDIQRIDNLIGTINAGELAIELNKYRAGSRREWAAFFLGTQLLVGKTKIYCRESDLRRRLVDNLLYAWQADNWEAVNRVRLNIRSKASEAREKVKSELKKLEDAGMLEIRRLGDKSKMFPYNNTIPPEQLERLNKMTTASDKEMVSLAMTILINNKQENNNDNEGTRENNQEIE